MRLFLKSSFSKHAVGHELQLRSVLENVDETAAGQLMRNIFAPADLQPGYSAVALTDVSLAHAKQSCCSYECIQRQREMNNLLIDHNVRYRTEENGF